jgi:ABC-type phosphate transport system substrate-binding protein
MTKLNVSLLGLVLLISAMFAQQAHAELAIIAHRDNAMMGISRDQLKRIYLGKSPSFPDGRSVKAVDQVVGSQARDQFNRKVLQMTESKRKSYWSRLVFTGKGKPPKSLNGDTAVLEWVANHPEGLGYITGSKVSKRVKVLLILP